MSDLYVLHAERGYRSQATVLGDGYVARLTCDYVCVMWFFTLRVGLRWELLSRDAPDVVMDREEIEERFGVELAEPGFLARWSLLLGALLVAVVLFAIYL